PPRSLLSFPPRRSSDLNAMHGDSISRHFRWGRAVLRAEQIVALAGGNFIRLSDGNADIYQEDEYATVDDWQRGFFTGTTTLGDRDRKSTRLNSSHVKIS